MKRIKLVLLVLLFSVASTSFAAQKIAYINSQELVAAMPDTKAAQDKLQAYAETLRKTSETMQKEYQTKFEDYNRNKDNLSPLIKGAKEKELQGIIQRIQEFNGNAQKEMKTKEAELLTPIREKAQKAISDVARKKGISYVLDKGLGGMLFEGEGSINLLDEVKKELKVK